MRHHPVRIGAPRELWTASSDQGERPPALLQRQDDRFIEATLEDLRTAAGRAALKGSLARARTKSQVLKLFHPVQRQFHVAVVEAWCDTAGTPRLDPARVEGSGLVIRRLSGDRSGRYVEGWVKSGGRLRGWARLGGALEIAAPIAAQRLAMRTVSPSIDRELRQAALVREESLLDEQVVPLFLAPPDVCSAAKQTLFYGVVPTASADLADVPVDAGQAIGGDFSASDEFFEHLVDALRGHAMAFELAGEPVHPGWFEAVETPGDDAPSGLPASHWAAIRSGSGNRAMKRFVLLLRQVAIEFDAFADHAEGQALFAALEAIRLPLVQPPFASGTRTVAAGTFLRLAASVVLERDPDAPRPEMPVSWPAIDAAARARLRQALANALTRRFADMKGRPGRFDDPAARYVVRAFVRLKADGACPPRTVWSAYSEPFVIAPWWEGSGAPPVQIALPDVADRGLLKALKPNVAFVVPPSLQNLLAGNPKDMLEGKGSTAGLTLGWICSFNIPVITICAFIVLNVFLSLFDLVFRWMLFIKICVPFPRRSES